MELIIDASSHVIVEAVGKNGSYSTFTLNTKIKHSQKLMNFTNIFLKENNISIEEIKTIGIGIGPGSFTGLRISIAFIKGLASILNTDITPIPTMDIYSYLSEKSEVYVIIPAREGFVYLAKYENRNLVGKYEVIDYKNALEKVNGKEVVGYGAEKLGIKIDWDKKYLTGMALIKAYKKIAKRITVDILEPIYVQEPLALRELEKRR